MLVVVPALLEIPQAVPPLWTLWFTRVCVFSEENATVSRPSGGGTSRRLFPTGGMAAGQLLTYELGGKQTSRLWILRAQPLLQYLK